MSSIVDGSKNSENNDERKGSSNERFMEVNSTEKICASWCEYGCKLREETTRKKAARKKVLVREKTVLGAISRQALTITCPSISASSLAIVAAMRWQEMIAKRPSACCNSFVNHFA